MEDITYRPAIRASLSLSRAGSPQVEGSPKNKTKALSEEFLVAAYQGDLPTVRSLLNQGVNINTQDASGNTALHIAVTMSSYSAVRLCVDLNIDINKRNHFNDTALSLAVEKSLYEIARLLLKNKVSHRLTNNVGKPLLVIASEQGSVDMVQLLLRYGANPNAESFGRTALYIARFPVRSVTVENSKAIIKSLLVRGADIKTLPIHEIINNPREEAETYLLYLAHGWNPWHDRRWMRCIPTDASRGWVNRKSSELYHAFASVLELHGVISGCHSPIQLSELLRYVGYLVNNRPQCFVPTEYISFSHFVFEKLRTAFYLPGSLVKHFADTRADLEWPYVRILPQNTRPLRPKAP